MEDFAVAPKAEISNPVLEGSRWKSIVVLVGPDEGARTLLRGLSKHKNLEQAESIQFVHIHSTKRDKGLPLDIDPYDLDAVEGFYRNEISQMVSEIIPGHKNPGNLPHGKVLFDANDKIRVLEFLKNQESDLVVLATKGLQEEEGPFSPSYAYWLVANSPCDVLVLRP